MGAKVVVFAVILGAAMALFAWTCYRRFSLVKMGKSDDRFDGIGTRIWNTLLYAFGQRKVVSRRFGVNHFVLHWCFLVLLVANTEFILHGLFPDQIALSKLPDGLHHALAFLFDLVSILALLAVCLALIRRFTFPPPHINARSRDALMILTGVGGLMMAFFGMHGAEIAGGVEAADDYMPISSWVGSAFFSNVSDSALEWWADFFWWTHAVVLLTFLNYLPFSKHIHILTAIPNCFFKSLKKVNTQPREEFKPGKDYGVGQVDHFSWKDLFDSYSCAECGRCSDICPATFTGKPLKPMQVIHDIKTNMLDNGWLIKKKKQAKQSLIGDDGEGSVAEEVLWACTTCGACMEVCPVLIEHVPKIVGMRRYLVEMQSRFPQELLNFFENVEQRSNPWGIAPEKRTAWTAEADVKPFEAGKTEYLFYVGCAGAFDSRSRHVTLAIAKLLNSAGVSWGILGKDEMCCGDSLRRLGNEFVFDRMVQDNIKMFKAKGVNKIITLCPHCYSTLRNDYRQYDIELEVLHHTEMINRLIEKDSLKLKATTDLGKVVFHDSCYLGRYNMVYGAPREAVASVIGQQPTEMDRSHGKSFCCGAGGGRMWLEESIGKRINVARVEEALEEEPKTICTCCPYCMTMFEDGLKDKKADDRVQVLDVAEIVSRALA